MGLFFFRFGTHCKENLKQPHRQTIFYAPQRSHLHVLAKVTIDLQINSFLDRKKKAFMRLDPPKSPLITRTEIIYNDEGEQVLTVYRKNGPGVKALMDVQKAVNDLAEETGNRNAVTAKILTSKVAVATLSFRLLPQNPSLTWSSYSRKVASGDISQSDYIQSVFQVLGILNAMDTHEILYPIDEDDIYMDLPRDSKSTVYLLGETAVGVETVYIPRIVFKLKGDEKQPVKGTNMALFLCRVQRFLFQHKMPLLSQIKHVVGAKVDSYPPNCIFQQNIPAHNLLENPKFLPWILSKNILERYIQEFAPVFPSATDLKDSDLTVLHLRANQ